MAREESKLQGRIFLTQGRLSVRISHFSVYLIFSHKKFEEDDGVSGAWQMRASNRLFLRVS